MSWFYFGRPEADVSIWKSLSFEALENGLSPIYWQAGPHFFLKTEACADFEIFILTALQRVRFVGRKGL